MLSKMANFIKKVLIIVCCLVAVFGGMLFAYENPEKISPIFWGIPFPALSLGYYLIFIFISGLIVGVCLGFWAGQKKALASRRETTKLKKQIKALEVSAEASA